MISKTSLKEIIASNEDFILKQAGPIVARQGIVLPESVNKVVVFYGVRRSGKTFLLFDALKRHKGNALYIDFEDERLAEFQAKDFAAIKDAFLELKPHLAGRELVFLLDEVQNIAGWEKFCRRAVERERIKVFVSGSSSRVMPEEMHTELRGRSWSIEVLPFSFREYLHARGIDTSDARLPYGDGKALLKRQFLEYMRWGGFPEVCFAKSELEKNKLLKEYFGAMFFRDLVERYSITNITLLEGLTEKLFSSFSTKFSLSSFYKQYKDKFPLSKDLLFRYYKYFLQSMLAFEVRLYVESAYKRMRNPPKGYLVDTGLCRRVTSDDAGRLLENVVYLELRRRQGEVFYWAGQRECDFVVKTPEGKFLPIQVCFEVSEANREREIEGLLEACAGVGVKQGLLLTSDEDREIQEDGVTITVLPVWRWAGFTSGAMERKK